MITKKIVAILSFTIGFSLLLSCDYITALDTKEGEDTSSNSDSLTIALQSDQIEKLQKEVDGLRSELSQEGIPNDNELQESEGRTTGNEQFPQKQNKRANTGIDSLQNVIISLNEQIHSLSKGINEYKNLESDIRQLKFFTLALSLFSILLVLYLFFALRKSKRKVKRLNKFAVTKTNPLSETNGKKSTESSLSSRLEESSLRSKNISMASLSESQKAQPEPVPNLWVSEPSSLDKHFFTEVMVTAGPRKNFDSDAKDGDYGLGEDVAGALVSGDKAFFWILDGTSDSNSISEPISDTSSREIFSSRLLAQSIAWNLQDEIANLPESYSAEFLLQSAIQKTEVAWKRQVLTAFEKNSEFSSEVFDKYGTTFQCSTTVIFGVLDLQGRLDVCQVGDCKLLTYPQKDELPKSSGRQFATLQKNGNRIELNFNKFSDLRSNVIQAVGINSVIAMTDGVSNAMENWLKQTKPNFEVQRVRETVAHFKQKTYDDKALCVVQIKG